MLDAVPTAPMTPAPSLHYVIRLGGKTDWPMVADAWVNSHKASSRATKLSEPGRFFKHHHRIIDGVLKDEETEVRVAAPPDDDFTVFGFAVLQRGLIHMVYVKKPFRRLGLARKLLTGIRLDETAFTYWTRDVGEWIHDKFPKMKFNPHWSEIL